MSIFFENELDKPLPGNYQDIAEDIIHASLDFLKCPYECEINVIFTNGEGIREINNTYRGIDAPTDVLSFPMQEYKTPGDFSHFENSLPDCFNQDTGELILGDIVLNVDKIAEQAELYGHTRRREIAFLTAHSMLHLAGYDHIDENERRNMEKLQEEILTTKGYTRENEEE